MKQDQKESSLPSRSRRWLRIMLLAVCLCTMLLAGGAGIAVHRFLHTAPESPGTDVEILIPSGYPFRELVHQLCEKKAITNEPAFLLLARYRKTAGKIKTGRFLVNTGWTPDRVLQYLVSGKVYLERITLPEGLPWWEIAKRLEAAGYVHFDDFSAVIHDPAFLRHWGIPFDSAEGFLFPDTYFIMRPLERSPATARSIAGRLVDTFWRKTGPLWPEGKRPDSSKKELVRTLVTLASIVEKETSVPDERKRVAGVYTNRLQIDMLLQADPTIAYGIGPSFVPPIRRSQLEDVQNPYNTYKRKGLPPGPICSPGLACLLAAAEPEKHDYLYFVARDGGRHTFSTNLNDHNQAVHLYRLSRKH